jgi:NAD(P)-dependent dehydrogenase (short-subunit alcohol dehydrogenase family)
VAIALITGGSRGIGLEFCRQLVEKKYKVFAAVRKPNPALSELGVTVIPGIDVSDPNSFAQLTKAVNDPKIDLLINNAGIFLEDNMEGVELKSVTEQFVVNTLGPIRTTLALRGKLAKGSVVGNVTSLMGSIGDNRSGGYYGYRMSKAALNAASVSLAHDLKANGVAVALLHPGYVQTDMTGHKGHITPTQSVSGMLSVLAKCSVNNTGTFWGFDGKILPW